MTPEISAIILSSIYITCVALFVIVKLTHPGRITNWKKDETNRSALDKCLRGEAPFKRGDVVECDVTVYNFRKGEPYTVSSCFETHGRYGWNWWIYADEVPVSSLASDFHLAETPQYNA